MGGAQQDGASESPTSASESPTRRTNVPSKLPSASGAGAGGLGEGENAGILVENIMNPGNANVLAGAGNVLGHPPQKKLNKGSGRMGILQLLPRVSEGLFRLLGWFAFCEVYENCHPVVVGLCRLVVGMRRRKVAKNPIIICRIWLET